jgi:hypothetical protein
MIRDYFEQYRKRWNESGIHFHALAIIAVMAFVGFVGIYGIKAATYVAKSEAEVGTITGNAALSVDATASGSNSVAFGKNAAPTAPATIKALTGGTSIAVVWLASLSSGVKNYEVYRNNVKVATVTPGTGTVQMELDGRRYIDTNVVRGTSYTYKVRAVSANGSPSAFSTSVTATHPTSTTATPSLSFEYIRAPAPANKAFVEATFKNEIGIWYPKIGDKLAFPTYTPQSSFIIETNPDILMGNAGNRIGYNPASMTAAAIPDLLGGGLDHELTHAVNQFSATNTPPWLGEGIADWTRLYLLERTPLVALPSFTKAMLDASGYAPAAAFIQYIEQKYDANFPRNISIAAHNNQFSDAIFTSSTGKTETQLIDEFRFSAAGQTGVITGIASKCVDITNFGVTDGTRLQLFDCANNDAQKWVPAFLDASNKVPANGGLFILNNYSLGVSKCMDISNAGTTDGTAVQFWDCNEGIAQQWHVGPNGSLVNPNSGKCLDTTGGTSTSGSPLIINTCNGSASQRWTVPS